MLKQTVLFLPRLLWTSLRKRNIRVFVFFFLALVLIYSVTELRTTIRHSQIRSDFHKSLSDLPEGPWECDQEVVVAGIDCDAQYELKIQSQESEQGEWIPSELIYPPTPDN